MQPVLILVIINPNEALQGQSEWQVRENMEKIRRIKKKYTCIRLKQIMFDKHSKGMACSPKTISSLSPYFPFCSKHGCS